MSHAPNRLPSRFERSPFVAALAGLLTLALGACGAFTGQSAERLPSEEIGTFHDLEARSIEGEIVAFSAFRGRPVLIVNTASECGFTDQYADLQALHERFGERGLVILGFPSNEFGGQEPGSDEQIAGFCEERFGVAFPMMSKVRVGEGEGQATVYRWLGGESGKLPGWNFAKYLVDGEGRVVSFWPSTTAPDDAEIVEAIERLVG